MQTSPPTQTDPITAAEAAQIMGCSVATVYRQLTPAKLYPNGWRLYAVADALAWTRRRTPRRTQAGAA